MLTFLRILCLFLLIFLLLQGIRHALSVPRKLEAARSRKRFLVIDNKNDHRKNILLTYKGVIFEGEKYLGIAEESFAVISILLRPWNSEGLSGMARADFLFIEDELLKSYPHALIEWKSPLKNSVRPQKLHSFH
jgi:hypothetical protein